MALGPKWGEHGPKMAKKWDSFLSFSIFWPNFSQILDFGPFSVLCPVVSWLGIFHVMISNGMVFCNHFGQDGTQGTHHLNLVSHYSAIGDTISCDARYGVIGFRAKLFLRDTPLLGLSWDCDRSFLGRKRSGGVAAIVCDTTANTVRQGYCYPCLAIGGGVIRSGH